MPSNDQNTPEAPRIFHEAELRRAIALASLREGWRLAEASGTSLAGDEDIEAEINRIRKGPEDD
jgi:hypothetical protein